MRFRILLPLCLLLTGCSTVYYVPNSQNVPVMEEAGQTNLYIGLNGSNETDGFELQGAYAVSDHVALQLNADWVDGNDDPNNSSTKGSKGHLIELGAGYYQKVARSFVFETYGLFGFGGFRYESSFKYNDTYDYHFAQADICRVGIQPSFSFSSKNFIASFSTRFAYLQYYNIDGYDNSSLNYGLRDAAILKKNPVQWLAEPALTLQTGFKIVKFQLQFVYSLSSADHLFNEEYRDPYMLSFGLKFSIPPNKNPAN